MVSDKENLVHSVCSICHEDIDYFAYGTCNHPTCTKCILKLRKFGSADEPDFSKCPTCRRVLNKIVIMESFVPFDEINTSMMRYDSMYDFMYSSQEIGAYYRNMLKSYCPICGEEKRSLSSLNRHTTAEHQLSYCDLCIRYSRLLPCEFVPMTPGDLSEHRKWDKQRKKGHPLCDFCEERFYENEDLVSHIRDNHFLCDLCMTTGKFVVFREQRELLDHYSDSHYLCPECRAQQRIACYSTADRLGLHRFQEHPNEVANDPNSWLPISIQMAPSSQTGAANRRREAAGPVYSVGGVLDSSDGRFIAENVDSGISFRRPNPEEWTGDDFPSLAAVPHTSDSAAAASGLSRISSRNQMTLPAGGIDALASAAGGTRPSMANSTTLALVTGRGKHHRLTADDFPSLPGPSCGAAATASPATWSKGGRNVPNTPSLSSFNGLARELPPGPGEFPNLPSARHTPNRKAASTVIPKPFQHRQQPPAPSTIKSTVAPTPPSAVDFPALLTKSSSRRGNGGMGDLTRSLPPAQSGLSNKPSSAGFGAKGNKQITDSKNKGKPQPSSNRRLQSHLNFEESGAPNSAYAILPEDRGEVFERPSQYTHIQTVESLPVSGGVVYNSAEEFEACPAPDINLTDEFPSLSAGRRGGGTSKKKKQPLADRNQSSQEHTQSANIKKAETRKSHQPPMAQVALPADTECIIYAETVYTPPPDMDARNRELIHNVEDSLFDTAGKTAFARFADLSRRYRHKQLTATAYMEGLIGLLTVDRSKGSTNDSVSPPQPMWIAPMLALLPDVSLQRALHRVLLGQGAPRLPQPDGSSRRPIVREASITPPPWAKQVLGLLKCCPQCGQVCLRSDMNTHLHDAHSVIDT